MALGSFRRLDLLLIKIHEFALRQDVAAQTDIVELLAHTQERFGELARLRYEHLLVTALGDLAVILIGAEPSNVLNLAKACAAIICG